MNQEWFEMNDVRTKKWDKSIWIPLRAVQTIEKIGNYGFIGYKEEFFGLGSIAVPINKKVDVNKLGWMDVGISSLQESYIVDGKYFPADVYEIGEDSNNGVHLVLAQHFNSAEISEWHLHQDFVISLCLKREGDVWVRPKEGYIEVARLRKDSNGKPYLLEVRSEHLKDYLCARNMALYIASYRRRSVVVDDASFILWTGNQFSNNSDVDKWQGHVREIHEGGESFGSEMAVFHVGRTDDYENEDIPVICDNDKNIKSESWTIKSKGRKLFSVNGELYKNEWIEPLSTSPRIKGDKQPHTVYFITDESGKKESKETLKDSGRWLWFSTEVINALINHRGGALSWYTRDTGNVSCSPSCGLHFGINKLGLINVFAEDVVSLPEWQQIIWAGYNVSPEGGVSEELLASQAQAEPARTQAPEQYLEKGIETLNALALKKLGFNLFRKHDQIPAILSQTHRFRAVSNDGLYSLAKDLSKIIADSLEAKAMQVLVPPPDNTKWGSLKTLEKLIASKIGGENARLLTGPLFGIYDMRLADAHLSPSDINSALALAKVDSNLPKVFQGFQLLNTFVSCIYSIIAIFDKWDGISPEVLAKQPFFLLRK